MQALILCAGEGKRLRTITKNKIAKVMVKILDKPVLQHHIELLKKYGIKEVFINLYTRPEQIAKYFGSGKKFGVRTTYSREDTKRSYKGPLMLGSAGALHNFKKKLKGDFFVLYGDVFMQVDLSKMLAFHKKKKSLFTIAVHNATHPHDSDLVQLSKNGNVLKWLKAGHGRKKGVNSSGLYIISSKVMKFLPDEVPFDFAHGFIPLLIGKVPVFGYYTEELMMDFGTEERYKKLLTILKK